MLGSSGLWILHLDQIGKQKKETLDKIGTRILSLYTKRNNKLEFSNILKDTAWSPRPLILKTRSTTTAHAPKVHDVSLKILFKIQFRCTSK